MAKIYHKRNPHRFWKWFSMHEEEFRNSKDEEIPYKLIKIYRYLIKFNPSLNFDLDKDTESGKMVLTFTSDGNSDLFETIFSLVEAAPAHLKKNWKIVALRQPEIEEVVLKFEDGTVTSKEIFYEIVPSFSDKEKSDILIFIEDIDYKSEELSGYIEIIFADIIQKILGEYRSGKYIDQIVMVDKEELSEPKLFIELNDEFID